MLRLTLIGLPVVYLIGAVTQATVYVTDYANTGWVTAALYGARWPVTALYATGLF